MKKLITILFGVALGLNLSAQDECMNPDVNCDGYVNVNDLLGLLGYFGDEDLDGDGIWDSQDDCVEDECGICAGPGPQVLAVDTITYTVDSLFVEAINEWYVFEVADTTFTFVCTNPGCTDAMAENYDPYASEDDGSCIFLNGFPQCDYQPTLYYQGDSYDLVGIGDDCWFQENLRALQYNDGDNIYYTNHMPPGDDASNVELFGRLYSWNAVRNNNGGDLGICPIGWHVSTMSDWDMLEMAVNGDASVLKASASNVPPWDGSDGVGFQALPAGSFFNDDTAWDYPIDFGIAAYFLNYDYCNGSYHVSSYNRSVLETENNQILSGCAHQHTAFGSIRCVMD